MTHYSIHSSRPDQWTSPRPVCNPALRAMAYGPIRPMHEPSWLDKLFGRY